jgi:hypothetical protein
MWGTVVADIFISYVEEDGEIARQLAAGLEEAGFAVWYYERDSLPAVQYTIQVLEVLRIVRIVIVIISPTSITSPQVDKEITWAHEAGKHFAPLLYGISHAAFRERRGEWAMMLGAAVSVPITAEGVGSLVVRLIRGLRSLGISPGLTQSAEGKDGVLLDDRIITAPRLEESLSPLPLGRKQLPGTIDFSGMSTSGEIDDWGPPQPFFSIEVKLEVLIEAMWTFVSDPKSSRDKHPIVQTLLFFHPASIEVLESLRLEGCEELSDVVAYATHVFGGRAAPNRRDPERLWPRRRT